MDALKAGTLIDAGFEAKDGAAVSEGVGLLEGLLERKPGRADAQYCLANGLGAREELAAAGSKDWYFVLADALRRARHLYQSAGSNDSAPFALRAEAYTNLANSLLRVYRVVEAYDWYARAIELDPTNGVALTGAARALIHLANRSVGDKQALLAVAAKYLAEARENPERIRELAGEQAFKRIAKLLDRDLPLGDPLNLDDATDYQRFVHRHRLALAAAIDGFDPSLSRWDSLHIKAVTASTAESGVPPVFAMFNTLKSEYLCARYLAYSALANPFPESGTYLDTLDYAVYGVRQSMRTLAQRSCLDLLDKVAVATCEYFGFQRAASSVYFKSSWFAPGNGNGDADWRPEIREAIQTGVTALIAISDVSRDVSTGGFLQQKVAMRNSSTHRFLVLHDLGCEPSRTSRYVDHLPADAFSEQLIETLRLARSVLFYFVEMVMQAEHRHHTKGEFRPQMFVPDHDWVRGGEQE